jgi:hypothetical protein
VRVGQRSCERQHRAPAADLDVVGVTADREDALDGPSQIIEAEAEH